MSAVNVIIDRMFRKILTLLLALVISGWLADSVNGQDVGEGKAEIKVVAILNTDELGERIRYPSFLGYDRDMDEIYVVVGGRAKIVVYGSNFFPTVSLGSGRGADSARGIYIHDDGLIYLCQGESENNPGRVTVFNQAFFPEQEITFDSSVIGEEFVPRDMVVGMTGNLYVIGQNNRGVLVLDKDGNFSHWLRPRDKIFDMEAVKEAQEQEEKSKPELTDTGMANLQEQENQEESPGISELLPPELVPGEKRTAGLEEESGMGPVKAVDVARDSEGHLYILSEETGKVYVYSPFEEFLFSFGEKGGSTGKLSRPKSLIVDEQKKAVYIADYMRHTILIFGLSGNFMYEFGGLGTGPGWFYGPGGLTLTRDGLLAVSDLFNNRVQILDVQFEYKFPVFKPPVVKEPELQEENEPEEPTVPEEGTGEEDILEPAPL